MNTMGEIISTRRKELGMTQKELAAKMNVTDKAVSKWERGIAYPDIQSVPQLAEVLEVSVVELMDAQPDAKTEEAPMKHIIKETIDLIFKVVPVAMSVAVVALAVMGALNTDSALIMLGLGMFCLAMRGLPENN
ncbi:MAG: helix-turn-helix transcriptional regulator [Oscillospiraceae bacterium]|nr:helix-turn-helix transcriptional regulator [Oscillospiraceae bacterium]